MKKTLVFLIMFAAALSLCSCSSNDSVLHEGQLLYDCGAETADDVTTYEFLYAEFTDAAGRTRTPSNPLEITDKADQSVFKYYNCMPDAQETPLHVLYLYPSNTFTLTVNDKQYYFYLHEDGSLTSMPNANVQKQKTYQADEKHHITTSQIIEWVNKYEPR